jgi:hypothetical protein
VNKTSCELYDHGDLHHEVLQLQSFFAHSTAFPVEQHPIDHCKHARNATCKDYFPTSDALEYTPKY